MNEKSEKKLYLLNDVVEIYKKYYLPTLKEEFYATIRVKTLILNYCNRLGLEYLEQNDEIYLSENSYDIIYRLIKNRYLFLNKSIELYSKSEVQKILGIEKRIVRNLITDGHLDVATLITNKTYFEKKQVDNIVHYLNKAYNIGQAAEIIKSKIKYDKLNIDTIREIANKLNITFDNIYFNKSKLILKSDINILIDYFMKKYKPREKKENVSWLEKFIKVKYFIIETDLNKSLIGQAELKKFYYKHTNIENEVVDTQFQKTLIGIVNKLKINLYLNKTRNYFYISNNDYEKYKCYIQENLLDIRKIYSYYSQEEIKTILEREYIADVIKDLPKVREGNKVYIEKKIIDELYELKNSLIGITELCEHLKVNSSSLYRAMKKFNIQYEDTKHLFIGKAIKRKYIKTLEDYFSYKNDISTVSSRYERYLIETALVEKNNKIPKTYEYYGVYVLERLKETNNNQIILPLIKIYKNILSNLKKEIFYHNDNEIEKIINIIKSESVEKEFIKLLNYFKQHNPIYSGTYRRDIGKETYVEAYTEEQWIRFGQLIFSRELPYFKISLKKAIKDRNSAMIWLYCALNYVCAWRKEDIINLPLPDIEVLDIPENQYLDVISDNKFTDEMAQKIVNNISNKIATWGLVANKTKKTNKQLLKFVISNGYVYTIGLLLYICEVHRRDYKLNKRMNAGSLINSWVVSKKEQHIKFFGEEYIEIFREESFTNIRATKTIINYTQKISQQKGWGKGYYLAAIQRGHKFNNRGVPEITQVYLESFNKDGDIDLITRELFERGTFGFIPYQLVKILHSERINGKKIKEQNDIINETVKIKATKIEKIIKNHYKIKYEIVNNILNKAIIKEIKIIDILKSISNGKASSKMSYSQCLLKTVNEECCYKYKEDCIGCAYLIPEMYFLMEFNNMINNHIEKISRATLLYDKKRLLYILINNYIPILSEAIEYLGKEKVCGFINIKKIKEDISTLVYNEKLQLD